MAITICPTLACNFECPYCFATRGRGKMAPEVADDVVALAGRMLDAAHATRLTITWFGGEPLMATGVIEALSRRLIAAAEERGCEYEAWVFTNGYLLSEEVVDLLLRCRVEARHAVPVPEHGCPAAGRQVPRVRVAAPVRGRVPAAAPVRQARVPGLPPRPRSVRAGHAGQEGQRE